LAFDLGCGSGVLSYFLSTKFNKIISMEIDRKTFNCASENLKNLENVHVINGNVLDHEFEEKADLIVCEMLDTALIDEEEIPVINHAKKFLKEGGKIIPEGIINTVELVNMERHHIHWDEGAKYETLSDEKVYSQFNFLDQIRPEFTAELKLKSKKDATLNGLKITSYTKLTEDIIAGPLPMLNPPLLVPLQEKQIKVNDFIHVEIKYIMGSGIETIKTKYL
jgi:predicted RNA methylase